MKRHLWIILFCVLIVSVGSVVFAAPAAESLENYVIGAGGAAVRTSEYEVSYTLGQPVVGEFEAGINELCAGYWCETEWRTYVPVVMRNM